MISMWPIVCNTFSATDGDVIFEEPCNYLKKDCSYLITMTSKICMTKLNDDEKLKTFSVLQEKQNTGTMMTQTETIKLRL